MQRSRGLLHPCAYFMHMFMLLVRVQNSAKLQTQRSDVWLDAEGAHAQDLNEAQPEDAPTVNQVRQQGFQNIISWIGEYNEAILREPTSNAADLFDLNYALGGYTSIWNDTLPGSNTSITTVSLNASAPLSNLAV